MIINIIEEQKGNRFSLKMINTEGAFLVSGKYLGLLNNKTTVTVDVQHTRGTPNVVVSLVDEIDVYEIKLKFTSQDFLAGILTLKKDNKILNIKNVSARLIGETFKVYVDDNLILDFKKIQKDNE